jgi:hypothetical protein
MFPRSGIGSFLWFSVVVCCGLTVSLSRAAIAQEETPTLAGDNMIGLLQRMHANLVANDELAQQYACDDRTHTVALNSSGKKIRDYTAKFEYVSIDGLPYIHEVEENGRPLSAEKMASSQKHQDAISELGRGLDFVFDLRDGNPRDAVYSALPICCLAALFENRLLKHDRINGRDNLVVESVPKANPGAVSPEDRTALDWKETTWIDVDDLIPTRYEVELLNDKRFLLKGSTERREFFRLEEASDSKGRPPQTVWLESSREDHANLKFLWQRQFESFEDTSYNYKRFKVDIRLLPDSVRDVSNQGANQKP